MADVGRASLLLASGTFVSRILGFLSAAVLAWTIGVNAEGANAFALANQLPNNIYAIVAGGLLSAILVPHIVRAASHDDGGQGFVNRLLTLGIVVFAVISVIATLAAPALVALYSLSDSTALGEGGTALAIAMAYWCLPQVFFYALYSLLGEVLNARGVFGPFTWAPVLNNIVAIGGLIAFGILFGTRPIHDAASSWDAGKVALLAGSATLGVAAQALILTLFWRRTGLGFRPDFRWRGVGLGAPARAAGWTFGMILVTQLAGILQVNAALTAGGGDASLAALRTTWLIFMLPHSIVAVSIATPYFTRLSAHVRDGDTAAFRADLSSSLRTIVALVTGAGVALVAAALPFSAFFAGDRDEAVSIALVLLAFLAGLVPFSALFVIQRGFFALGDTRTPFFIQLVQAILFVAGTTPLFFGIVDRSWIAATIALVTSIAGTIQALLAAIVLRRRLGGTGGTGIFRRFIVFAAAAIPAVITGVGMLALLGGFSDTGFATAGQVEAAVATAAVGGVALAVYAGVLLAVRAPEVRGVLAVLRRGR